MRYTCALALATTLTALAQQPFSTLQTGFNQSVYGTTTGFYGGLAFAPNGDVMVNNCLFSGSGLTRFNGASTTVINGTTVHPQAVGSPLTSNAGCGITNHPNGNLYSNTSLGVTVLNASTGAQIGAPIGPGGNALGITVDPLTKNLIYIAADCRNTPTCTILSLNPTTGVSTNFAVLSSTDSDFADGVYFDSTGNYLFLSNRSPAYRLTVLNRAGTVVQHVAMTSEPDGIAFHVNPNFVVTNNTDGTMTRFDFPNNDFTKVPASTLFASGGHRGDLTQVGGDSCLYITQDGTNYANGLVTADDSIVRICPGFVPPTGTPGVPSVTGHMIGDGPAIKDASGIKLDYQFVLQCAVTGTGTNSFDITWPRDNEFKLTSISAAACYNDSAIAANPAGFNTYVGSGKGSLNGVPGASIQFTFTDGGNYPLDTANIVIQSNGVTVFSVKSNLVDGDQKAYK